MFCQKRVTRGGGGLLRGRRRAVEVNVVVCVLVGRAVLCRGIRVSVDRRVVGLGRTLVLCARICFLAVVLLLNDASWTGGVVRGRR